MSRNFFGHDDRGPSTSKLHYPRQNFVMGRQGKFRHKNAGGFPGRKSRNTDLDGDVDMNGGFPGERKDRFNPYSNNQRHNRKGGKKHGKSKYDRPSDHDHSHSWFKVTVPYGRKHGKEFIIKSINSIIKVPFLPFNFSFNGNVAEFYVEGFTAASHLKEISRRITTPDGFKMNLFTSRCGVPLTGTIDTEILEKLKTSMSANYDPISHSLNLSKFHTNEVLRMQGLYLPLSKATVVSAVAKVIKEHIPEIASLNLSNNKMYTLDALSSLVNVCKDLKFLNLQNNKLRNISELNYLKGIDLGELILDGNPLCDDFKDKASYISAVRERFPQLIRLDGHDLPAPIGFDLGTETLPTSQKSFFASPEVKDLVIQFLDAYYSIYDSGDRTKLLDAYHDQACFSLCLSKNTTKSSKGIGAYTAENRNILTINDSGERNRLLKQGKLSVVNALQELPQTNHDPASFSIDIFHVSPGLMSFSVIGVFKEVGAEINNATLKTFCRTFVVIPQGPGFVIVNETLFIAHASTEQQSKAFKVPAPTPSPSPAPPAAEEKSPSEKQMLVLELSKQTRMNIEFSTKCLEENDWDFQRALAVFMKFHSEGKLPPEAFAPV